jgi:AbrB family looped-hinge helix DNA binding protein
MTVTVKGNAPLIVPPSVRRRVGLKSGDKVVFQTDGRVITILPKEELDVDDEYTPAQRKIIDAEIAEGLAEIRRGEFYGPFKSAKEMAEFLEGDIAKSRRERKKRRR